MLAKKNKDIKKAYDLLEAISKDDKARMAYEAREAEIPDQLARMKSAEDKGREEGIKEGIEKGKLEIAKASIKKGLEDNIIVDITGLPLEKIKELKKKIRH